MVLVGIEHKTMWDIISFFGAADSRGGGKGSYSINFDQAAVYGFGQRKGHAHAQVAPFSAQFCTLPVQFLM
jgi:hypothetical protein